MINTNIFQVSIGLNHNHPEIVRSINNMRNSNPSWTYHLITEKKEIDNFMLKNFGQSKDEFEKRIFKTYQEIPNIIATQSSDTENKYLRRLVSQLDLYRVALIYTYGGLYLDIDSELKGDFNQFTNSDAVFFIPSNKAKEIFNAVFYSVPKHEMLKILLKQISDNILINKFSSVYQACGPDVHTRIAQRMLNYDMQNKKEILNKQFTVDKFGVVKQLIEDRPLSYSFRYTDAYSESLMLTIEAGFKKYLYGGEHNSYWNKSRKSFIKSIKGIFGKIKI